MQVTFAEFIRDVFSKFFPNHIFSQVFYVM